MTECSIVRLFTYILKKYAAISGSEINCDDNLEKKDMLWVIIVESGIVILLIKCYTERECVVQVKIEGPE